MTPLGPPLDTVYSVISTAKVRLNEELSTLQPVSGKLLLNSQAFTQQIFNTGYRKFQEFLANLGYTALIDQQEVLALPACTSTDPASQVYINWFGYFDGTVLQNSPVLPASLIQPLWVKERQNDYNGQFSPMEIIFDGLPQRPKNPRNNCWEWRQNAIYMPGSVYVMDIQVRFISYYPDVADNQVATPAVPWFQQSIPIVRCQDALSWFVAAELSSARSELGLSADKFWAKGEAAARLVFNRDAKMKQRGNIRRQSRSGRLEGSCGYGDGAGWY